VGAFTLDGMMIDRPVIAQARQTLAWADEQRSRGAEERESWGAEERRSGRAQV
jgi:hypothetical protein